MTDNLGTSGEPAGNSPSENTPRVCKDDPRQGATETKFQPLPLPSRPAYRLGDAESETGKLDSGLRGSHEGGGVRTTLNSNNSKGCDERWFCSSGVFKHRIM